MEIIIDKIFDKDIDKISDNLLLIKIDNVISNIIISKTVSDIKNIKKLTASTNSYRIRINNHRLGIELEGDKIILVRFLKRDKIYDNFPRD